MMQQLFGDYRQKMHEEDLARQKRLFFVFVHFSGKKTNFSISRSQSNPWKQQ